MKKEKVLLNRPLFEKLKETIPHSWRDVDGTWDEIRHSFNKRISVAHVIEKDYSERFNNDPKNRDKDGNWNRVDRVKVEAYHLIFTHLRPVRESEGHQNLPMWSLSDLILGSQEIFVQFKRRSETSTSTPISIIQTRSGIDDEGHAFANIKGWSFSREGVLTTIFEGADPAVNYGGGLVKWNTVVSESLKMPENIESAITYEIFGDATTYSKGKYFDTNGQSVEFSMARLTEDLVSTLTHEFIRSIPLIETLDGLPDADLAKRSIEELISISESG